MLFKEIAEQITQATQDGTKIDFSSYTPKELKVYLNTKQEKFEKLIVKHASEWHDKSNSHMFNSIVEAGRKILEDKLITRFISRDEYDSSDYKKLVLEAHDKLVDHEKERIDKFAWMQDASELNIPKEIWHFWPFVSYFNKGYSITSSQMDLLFPHALKSKKEEVRTLFNTYAAAFEINTNERAAQFFAQIRAEVGSKLEGSEESLWYSVNSLKSIFKRYFASYPNEADDLGYKRISLLEYKLLPQDKKSNYTKKNSYYYNQLPQEDEIAKRVYSCDSQKGDFILVQGGDKSGINYKGKGFIQLTWKSNYKVVQERLEEKIPHINFNILDTPDIILNTREGFLSALGYWDVNNLNDMASSTTLGTDKITDIVNYYLDEKHKEKRREYFLNAYKALNNE